MLHPFALCNKFIEAISDKHDASKYMIIIITALPNHVIWEIIIH